ncbi:MAG: hypothetical protein ACD_59C00033G0005 [uncultured bacterium]|nr:MAG: hypothetical protein ACD_59C00033G0005 [uncultured bacterium]
MSLIIKVENLSKKYVIGHKAKERYKTLRDTLAASFKNFFVGKRKVNNPEFEDFWALKDIDYEINEGDRVGIIGRNGAGKSTLLKILSRITEPTTGKITFKGRVASLLEVGTGFHPELTGRENIFLNGAILGMPKNDIQKKFDEIVEFSEVEKFLDTPVKRYSSGMYVRLAFAVAAHMEPEILIVDEVLAVGDAAFQKKCLGKMKGVSESGRTVLFVSHNMGAIEQLCNRGILLDKGLMVLSSDTNAVLSKYREFINRSQVTETSGIGNESTRRGTGELRITSFQLLTKDNEPANEFDLGSTIRFKIGYKAIEELKGLAVAIFFKSNSTNEMISSLRHEVISMTLAPGNTGEVIIEFDGQTLRPGEYPLYIHISEKSYYSNKFDLLDGYVAPLVIRRTGNNFYNNYVMTGNYGYFSMNSSVISVE